MERVKKKLYEVDWYTKLQKIREQRSSEEWYLARIADIKRKGYTSISEMSNRDLMVMFDTLLLSYPALAKRQLDVWKKFRLKCTSLVEGDIERSTLCLSACLLAVIDYVELESLKCIDDPDHLVLSEPFDYLDKVITLKDNKGEMPFSLIYYDDDRLEHVVETIKTINIGDVIKGWIERYPSRVYPEVYELFEIFSKGDDWGSQKE